MQELEISDINKQLQISLAITKILNLKKTILQAAPFEHVSYLDKGEPGTGKESIARAIHENSGRKGKYIIINCPALPKELLESELFGHEKGSFTGADEKKDGKLLEANGGTVFLDEIGDISLECQKKLLRVLEGGKVVRVGGTEEFDVDVRFIGATNQNVKKKLKDNELRPDFIGRFEMPIETVNLNEFREDIPRLIKNFIHKEYERYKDNPNLKDLAGLKSRNALSSDDVFTKDLIDQLSYHKDWSGVNVRGLRNVCRNAFKKFSFTNEALTELSDIPQSILDIYEEHNEMWLPELPLPLELNEYKNAIIEKARKEVGGIGVNNQLVDDLLRQNHGVEKKRAHREKHNKKSK